MDFKSELNELEKAGLKREIFCPEAGLVNLSSNDYLGLSHHPDVIQAAAAALAECGAGGTSSRLLAGTKKVHQDLENSLAAFLNKDSALVFSSGYHANTGILPALLETGDAIFFDRLCHASIIDGIRLSSARFYSFEHNDIHDLKKKLAEKRPGHLRAVVVTEGIFSMDGDVGPIAAIAALAKEFDALVYLDEAHSFGVIGPEGRGLAARENVLNQIDIFVGTLSKTLGSQGGFAACSGDVRDYLISKSRAFIYTTALAPACAAAAAKSVMLLPALEDRRKKVDEAARFLRHGLKELGYDTLNSSSQIIPVWTGDVEATKKLSTYLLRNGFFVPSIRPPTVPSGEGRVRLSITYDIAGGSAEDVLAAFKRREEIVQV